MTESNKRTGLLICIALSLLPSLFILQLPVLVTLKTLALWASAVLGYMGIVMLLWMYILGAKSVMGIVFTDLAPVLKIHKWLGKYGTVAIFLHPILITYSYGEGLLYSIIPKISTLSERHILLGQIAFWLLVLTWLISAYLRKKMTWRTWRYLHWLAYVCIPFALLHVPDLGSQERTHLLVKGYFFSLVLVCVAFSILRLRGLLNLDRSVYAVARKLSVTELDVLIKLRPQGPRHISPRRGQYVYIKLGFLSEDHPFSVTQYDAATGEITLAIRRAGMYTKELEKLSEGSEVYLSGPFGSFTQELTETSDTPVVYIAGGIGITPFVDRIMNERSVREQWLFAANRSRELAVLYAPLKKQLGDHAVAIYSQQDGPLAPGEESGRLNADLLTRYLSDPARYSFYICGPPAMMAPLRASIASLGVQPKHIHSEKFGW